MGTDTVTRRSFIAATGAASTAGADDRQPVVSPTFIQTAMPAHNDPIRIVTTYDFEPHEIDQIRQAASPTGVEIVICTGGDEFRAKLAGAEVVYGSIRGEDLALAPKLKWVQHGAAGVDFLRRDEKYRNSSVVMTNYARTFAPAISETAIGLLICLTRGISKYYVPQFGRRAMEEIGTVKSADHVEISGRTMGIVGMGGIGSAVARRAHYGFDMRILATDAKPIPKPEYVAELHDPGWFDEMVPQADVLVAAAPLTGETEGMFNERVFRAMKKTAYFLALSRGPLFDDQALVKALKEGWIAGAGLDVFPVEPPPPEHPIYDCDNVVMTPHTSGWSVDRQERLITLFAENVRRYARGLPLINVVVKQRGY